MTLETFLSRNDKWLCTYCEPVPGWPGRWTVIWRGGLGTHGRIGTSVSNRGRPRPETIARFLVKELTARYHSRTFCDAKSAAGLKYRGEPDVNGNYWIDPGSDA